MCVCAFDHYSKCHFPVDLQAHLWNFQIKPQHLKVFRARCRSTAATCRDIRIQLNPFYSLRSFMQTFAKCLYDIWFFSFIIFGFSYEIFGRPNHRWKIYTQIETISTGFKCKLLCIYCIYSCVFDDMKTYCFGFTERFDFVFFRYGIHSKFRSLLLWDRQEDFTLN